MSVYDDYATAERVVEQLRGASERFNEVTDNPQVDKKGIGFNRDRRFAAFRFELAFSSWAGVFGDSGCQRVINFSDPQAVTEALVRYLNRHWTTVFEEMADDIEERTEEVRETRIAELEAELTRLRGARPEVAA
jgi:hypothetical protein